jgi:hypothetical protein
LAGRFQETHWKEQFRPVPAFRESATDVCGVPSSRRSVELSRLGDVEQRQRTMQRIRDIVSAPIGLTSLVLVTGLAFAINAVEFLCSAALPAVYTHMLSLMDLSTPTYYGYIALYVLFFMLDDLVIFGLAAFAVQRVIDTRYAAISRAAGGVTLLGLGLWMLLR